MNSTSEAAREFRLSWIRRIITSCGVNRGFRPSEEQASADAKLAEKRFENVKTSDFSEMFDLGQKCQAESVDDFLSVWQIELQSRQREAEIERRRCDALQEQKLLMSPHPNRDHVFQKWGYA